MVERVKQKRLKRPVLSSYSMKAVMIITLILAIWKQEWLWVLGCIVGIFIGFIPTILKRDIHITIPWSIELLIATVLALNMVGVLLNAYYRFPGFGQLTQFLTAILVAFFAFAIIYIVDKYWEGLNMDRSAMAFVVVITTMAAGVIMEFIKYFNIFGKKQFTVEEVLMSLLITTIAGIIMAAIGASLIKKGHFERITDGLTESVDSTIIKRMKK